MAGKDYGKRRSEGESDFRKFNDTDFGDSNAYRYNPATKMTNRSLGGIRDTPEDKLIGINDPRPPDPREAADELMRRRYYDATDEVQRAAPRGPDSR